MENHTDAMLAVITGVMLCIVLATIPVAMQYWRYLKKRRSKDGREG